MTKLYAVAYLHGERIEEYIMATGDTYRVYNGSVTTRSLDTLLSEIKLKHGRETELWQKNKHIEKR